MQALDKAASLCGKDAALRSTRPLDGARTMTQQYYSARLLHIAVVGGRRRLRKHLCDETVFVFRATSDVDAFRRAIKIGRSHEHEYRNKYRQIVRWAFAEVIAMTCIGRVADGLEVSSRLYHRVLSKRTSLRQRFHPERSKPQWA